ncbi:hypothetical protein ACE40W_22780 [Enterococcus avium]|uniref:hypothetical protein n=1 Tax=Enterococcus avium TaxID=33945 RepID=UPI0035C96B7A
MSLVESLIDNVRNRVRALENWQTAQQDWNGRWSARITNLESWRTSQQNWNAGVYVDMGKIFDFNALVKQDFNTLFNWKTAQQNWNANTYVDMGKIFDFNALQRSFNNNVTADISNIYKWIADQKATNKKYETDFSTIYSWIADQKATNKKHETDFGTIYSWIADQKATNKKYETDLGKLFTFSTDQKSANEKFKLDILNIYSWVSDQKTFNENILADQSKLFAFTTAQAIWNTSQSNRIGALESADTDIKNSIKKEIDDRKAGDTALDTAIKKEVDDRKYSDLLINNQFLRVEDSIDETNDRMDAKDTELANTIKKESDDRKVADAATALKLLSVDQAISDLNTRIDNLSFDFSDLGIIAAINSLKQSNENLWNADSYDGASVGANDGKAVRLFKNQFQGLKTHYAGIMKYYFDMNDPNSAIYKLRYSIVAGFGETGELLEEWFTTLLESQNTTNSYLGTIADWLEMQNAHFKKFYEVYVIITQWLEQIYKKPPPVVNVTIPPLELDENGNGWLKTLIKTVGDVMKTAIETLGSLLETAIGEVGQLLRDLLAFLDGLIDDLIQLVVPENFDFLDKDFGKLKGKFDVKFGDILSVGSKIKDTFTPNKKDFFKAISFTFMGAKFEPGSSATDMYVPMFRLATQVLIWLYVAWFAYEKATGKGDLINDN